MGTVWPWLPSNEDTRSGLVRHILPTGGPSCRAGLKKEELPQGREAINVMLFSFADPKSTGFLKK